MKILLNISPPLTDLAPHHSHGPGRFLHSALISLINWFIGWREPRNPIAALKSDMASVKRGGQHEVMDSTLIV
jgi:hypothetical protein